MSNSLTRTSRSRPTTALLTWAGLICVALQLSNSRISGRVYSVDTAGATATPIVILLAAFTTFIAIFAWVLFNPHRKTLSDSPTFFLAASATILPPPVIGFCLMPAESPLRGWVALAMFLLCAVALLSHLPDDLAKVPRSIDTYLTPIPAFDGMEDEALNPNSEWFQFNALSDIVSDTPRPSLAPKEWLGVSKAPVSDRRSSVGAVSSVEALLSSDSDLSLLDDPLWDPETESESQKQKQREAAADQSVATVAGARAADAVDPEAEARDPQLQEPGSPGTFRSPLTSTGIVSPEEEEAAADAFFASENVVKREEIEIAASSRATLTPAVQPHVDRQVVDGLETVEGILPVSFEAGQKRANLHIPFSPPLSAAPEIECASVGEEDVRLKVAVAQPWGVRVEVRRLTADDQATAEIGFHATSPEAPA